MHTLEFAEPYHIDVPAELAEADPGTCCYGAAEYGSHKCTCWEKVHDLAQAEPQQGPAEAKRRCCADCAYRNGSAEDLAGDRDSLIDKATQPGFTFACHEGMRRIVRYVHPDGREFAGGPADYDPLVRHGRSYQADGQPAKLCAGYLAHRGGLP